MAIIISNNGKDAERIDKSSFDKEANLQEYIYDNPESIPLYDIKEDIRLLILAREFPTNSGPIDAIGVDNDGEIYVIETKLYKNPDKRTVVAQALDYGAALWRHANNYGLFVEILEQHTKKEFNLSLSEKLTEFYGADTDTDELLNSMRRNLNDGTFRFVVLMDEIDDRLKDLVVYVNQNSQFDIYAVQLEHYKYEQYEIVIPKLFGAQVKKNMNVTRQNYARRKWTEDEVLAEAEKTLDEKTFVEFRKLYDFSREHADSINLGSGIKSASFGPVFDAVGPRTVFSLYSNGTLSPNFEWLDPLFRDRFLAELIKVDFPLTNEDIDHRPHWASDIWVPRVDAFLVALRNSLDG